LFCKMKKMQWLGTETEFLEFMMFIDTILYEITGEQSRSKKPSIYETAKLLERFIDVDYKNFENFFDLRMHGRPQGIFFHGLLRIKNYYRGRCDP